MGDSEWKFIAAMGYNEQIRREADVLEEAQKEEKKLRKALEKETKKMGAAGAPASLSISVGGAGLTEEDREWIQDEIKERARELYEDALQDEIEDRVQERLQEIEDDKEDEEWWRDDESFKAVHDRGVDVEDFEDMEDCEKYQTLLKIGLDPANYKSQISEYDYLAENWSDLERLAKMGVDIDDFLCCTDEQRYEEIDACDLNPKRFSNLFEDPDFPENYVDPYDEEDEEEEEDDEPDWDLDGTDEGLIGELKKHGLDLAAFLKMNDFEKFKFISGTWLDPYAYERFYDDYDYISEDYDGLVMLEEKGIDIAGFLGLSDEERIDLLESHGLDPEEFCEAFEDWDYPEDRKNGWLDDEDEE